MDHRNIWKGMQAGDAYKMNVTVSGAGKEGWGRVEWWWWLGKEAEEAWGGEEMHKELLIGLRGHRPPLH